MPTQIRRWIAKAEKAGQIAFQWAKEDAALLFRTRGEVKRLKNELHSKRRLLQHYGPLMRSLRFAQECNRHQDALRADAYVAHDVLPLLGMQSLMARHKARGFCDIVESLKIEDRTLQGKWSSESLMTIGAIVDSYLPRCDGLFTIGPSLAQRIQSFHVPVHVIPNYRCREPVQQSDALRRKCNLTERDKLVVAISSIVTGFGAVVDALALMPENVHLATLSRFVPKTYGDEVLKLVEQRGLQSRVHFLDPVPYEQLAPLLSGADAGLLVLAPSIGNHYISLPNRVFDYLAAGLPFCTPDLPDIAAIAREHRVGAVVRELTPAGWAEAMTTVLQSQDELRRNAIAANDSLNWESLEPALASCFEGARTVAFLGCKNLTTNNRTRRMAMTLVARGAEVIVCTDSVDSPVAPWHPRIRFHFLNSASI